MKIFMIGDSTMKYNNIYSYPQNGWGQQLQLFVKPGVLIEDYAEKGRSTKSFIAEKRFDFVLGRMNKGDYLIVQFGHNDEKINDPNRYTEPFGEYQKNLDYFAKEAVKKGCHVVFATSITRHLFENGKCINSHGDYPKAMIEFAKENGYTCIDMNQITIDLYNKIGEEESKKFHMIFGPNIYETYMDGKNDHSHLMYDGAVTIAKLFVEAIEETKDPINECFLNLKQKEEIDWNMLID